MKNLIKVASISVLMGLSGAVSAAVEFNPAKPVMTKLKDGVYQYFQFFYTSLVVVTDDGVIVTDPSGDLRAQAMREEISKLTDKPVVKVIYSHDHFDHSRGGSIFKDEGAEFIAHENCTALLSRDLEKKVVQPDITYKDKLSVEVGGKAIDLNYYGTNDGTCMSVVHMPEDKVLYAVDWHLQGMVNEPYRLNTHDYVSILNTFEKVRAELDFDTVIGGHMAKSSPEQFEEDYRFNKALFDAVWAGMQEGKSVDELKETVKLPEFSHWLNYDRNLSAHVERMAYSIWHGN